MNGMLRCIAQEEWWAKGEEWTLSDAYFKIVIVGTVLTNDALPRNLGLTLNRLHLKYDI